MDNEFGLVLLSYVISHHRCFLDAYCLLVVKWLAYLYLLIIAASCVAEGAC